MRFDSSKQHKESFGLCMKVNHHAVHWLVLGSHDDPSSITSCYPWEMIGWRSALMYKYEVSLAIKAHASQTEPKLLLRVSKIHHSHIHKRKNIWLRWIHLKNAPILTWTPLASVMYWLYIMCVLLCQLLAVGSSEAQCVSVTEGGAVQPSCWVLTQVCETLSSCRA